MGQRDRAEKKVKDRHGSGAWHPSKAAEKAQRATVKAAKRARRRLDAAIVHEESAPAEDRAGGATMDDLIRRWLARAHTPRPGLPREQLGAIQRAKGITLP